MHNELGVSDTDAISFSQFRINPAKVNAPFTRRDLLARDNLREKIARFPHESRLLTMEAPPGSGKSTAMVELSKALTAEDILCVWLNLDADDDAPSVFAKYVIALLFALDRDAAKKEFAFLTATPARDYDLLFDNLIRRVTLHSRPTCIFVDDFQHLSDPSILRFWNRFMGYAPSTMRIVLASRVKFPLELARHRLSGSLVEITQSDLNFTAEEVFQFLKEIKQIELPKESTEFLHHSTEGWAAGLQLAAMAIDKNKDDPSAIIRSFTGRDKNLAEYLLESVFYAQTVVVQKFLLESCPLLEINAKLCDYVGDRNDSNELIAELKHNNLFLIQLSGKKDSYRYHHLFHDFLRNEFRSKHPEKYVHICLRASEWCESHGRTNTAIQYMLISEQFERAADLIADRGYETAMSNGDHFTILDWMRRLPEDFHTQRPEILLNHAWSRAFSIDISMAFSEGERLLKCLDNPQDYGWQLSDREIEQYRWLTVTTVAIAEARVDNLRTAIDTCEKTIRKVTPDQNFVLATLSILLSYAHYIFRDYPLCSRYAADGYRYGRIAGSDYSAVWANYLQGLANIEMGKLGAAQENADRARSYAGKLVRSNSYLHAMTITLQSAIYLQRCDFSALKESRSDAFLVANNFEPLEPLLISITTEAHYEAWLGNIGKAKRVLHQGQEAALSTKQARLYYSLIADEVNIQLRLNDLAGAEATVSRTNLLNADLSSLPSDIRQCVRENIRITEARLLIAREEYMEALELLNSLIYSLHGGHNIRIKALLTLRTLKAITLWKLDKAKDGLRELDRAINIGVAEQQAYPIVSAADITLIEMLSTLHKQHASTTLSQDHKAKHDFEAHLIMLLQGETPSPNVDNNAKAAPEIAQDTLTSREIEILKLVSAGLDNKQLSENLVISVSTVKWHLHNIFEKLEVRSRTAAAAKARSMNLIH